MSESEVSWRWRETVAGVIYRHEPEADTHYPRGHRIDFTASHANALEALLAKALTALEANQPYVELAAGISALVATRDSARERHGLNAALIQELREASNK